MRLKAKKRPGFMIYLPALLRKALQAGNSRTMFYYTYVLISKKDQKLYIDNMII